MTPEIALKAFLSQLDPTRSAALLELASPQTRAALGALPAYTIAPTSEEPLGAIHWSWFLPHLKGLSPFEQSCCLAVAPCPQIEQEPASLTPLGRNFVSQYLFQPLSDGYIPLAWLPPSQLLPLAQMPKRQLEALIDHLALFDLAVALRQIVDTKLLKQIRAQLTETQLQHLQHLATAADRSPYPTLELDRIHDLHAHLHRRGLLHLAAALSRQSPALLWHIAHRLDIGRGTLLCKLADEVPASLATWSSDKILSFFPKI